MPNLAFGQKRSQATSVRLSEDSFELVIPSKKRFRILQLTDTHFGAPTIFERAKDEKSKALIRSLVEAHQPDMIFHTGDFINNDKVKPEFNAIDFMNSLETPWSVVFGNHDHPTGETGQRSLDEYVSTLGNAMVGFAKHSEGRDYCYRINLRQEGQQKPFSTLMAFNTGGPTTGMKVTASETHWFQDQLEKDRSKAITSPILVMQHIPMIEYRDVFDQNLAVGRRGENVCFEQDKGEIFAEYAKSGRVRAVFCGHDHVNDYVGALQGVKLVYGRCSGYSGYGDWERGARLIDVDTETGQGMTRVVLGKAANEKAEWSKTLKEIELG